MTFVSSFAQSLWWKCISGGIMCIMIHTSSLLVYSLCAQVPSSSKTQPMNPTTTQPTTKDPAQRVGGTQKAAPPALPSNLFRREIEIADSIKKASILQGVQQGARIQAKDDRLKLFIQNVDITRFPEVGLVVEAMSNDTAAFEALENQKLSVLENGKARQVISVKKISAEKRIPMDFVFVLDITATMQDHINAVRDNVDAFAKNLLAKGIDFRLGLVMYSDSVEVVKQPTGDVQEFLWWLRDVQARGGKDEKENSLDALAAASNRIKYRPSASKMALLITDAPYHQKGEDGDGTTSYTTQSIIDTLVKREMKVVPITKTVFQQYNKIATATRGTTFDISKPFATILDTYSRNLTNMYAITYRSEEPALPDSINVAVVNEQNYELVRRTIPILQIGRKLIIEDLLFATNKAIPVTTFQPQLERIAEFMMNRKTVVIRVEGHTDGIGGAEYNLRLSMQRAEAVKTYLIQRTVAAHRIHTLGFGKSRPIATNDTDIGRRLNRRTEIVILEK
ncbi:MAG: VWA domain-containing protein [Candidatus Kapaibacterium sp.]|nr:MAG: VWA domain-containing protein [Candidatus Kapabacteria bacterium]